MRHKQHIQSCQDGKMRKAIRSLHMALICMLLGMGVLASCSKDPVDEPVIEEQTLRRTVLVYMVADNTLNSDSKMDRQEMLRAANEGAIPSDCNMLIYFLDKNTKPALYRVTPDSLEHLVDYSVFDSSVSAQRMLQVIDDAKRISPAKEYGMVLWSHANGWYEDGLNENVSTSRSNSLVTPYSFGVSNNNKDKMNITTLARVLEGQEMDFLYFDCCFMGNVEALYELRNCTKQVYASAAEMPAEGSRWDLCTQDLFAPGQADLVKAAQRNYEYFDGLSGGYRTLTVSVINMEHLEELADICSVIYEQAPSPLIPTGYTVMDFGGGRGFPKSFYDLTDYVTALTQNNPELMDLYNQCMDKVIAYKAATPYLFGTIQIKSHCGLTVNIISSDADANKYNYRNLEWFTDVTQKLKY